MFTEQCSVKYPRRRKRQILTGVLIPDELLLLRPHLNTLFNFCSTQRYSVTILLSLAVTPLMQLKAANSNATIIIIWWNILISLEILVFSELPSYVCGRSEPDLYFVGKYTKHVPQLSLHLVGVCKTCSTFGTVSRDHLYKQAVHSLDTCTSRTKTNRDVQCEEV